MTLNRTNAVLAVVLVIVVGLTALSRVDHTRPNIEVLPDMKYTSAWTAFAANPVFPNGRTLQEPVPGTIPRGELPLYYEATKEDAARAGEELLNPYHVEAANVEADADEALDKEPATENAADASDKKEPSEAEKRAAAARERLQASIARGGDAFRVSCLGCHGPKGEGNGLVTQHGFPPPPSLLTGKSRQMKDGQLFHILTYGQGSMEPFAAQLPRHQRWDLINYVRDLQSKAPLPPDAATPEAAPAATPGEAVDAPVTTEPNDTEPSASPAASPKDAEATPAKDEAEENKAKDNEKTAPEDTELNTPRNKLRDSSPEAGNQEPASEEGATPESNGKSDDN